jgi:NOL1/NOP2/fmu family ribosome biogenesis protein
LAEETERHRILSDLEKRFGIRERLFENYFLLKGKRSWWLLKKFTEPTFASRLKVARAGLRAFQKVGPYVKPTTRMIQIFGREATKGKVELDENQLSRLLAGEALSIDLDIEAGYVILFLGADNILGMGLFTEGLVRSQIPHKGLRPAMLPSTLSPTGGEIEKNR